MVNEIVLAIDPALRKIEDILLWKNKIKTVVVFSILHFIFWIYYMFNVRTYCMISCICLFLHLLDAYRTKKRKEILRLKNQAKNNLAESISSLGRYIIFIYSKANLLWVRLKRIKSRNRLQYFLILLVFWSMTTVIGVKIKGVYLSYGLFWFVFFVPAILHYEVLKKILRKMLPLLQQLDHSMKYERRSVLDKKELLVDVKLPKPEYEEDDDEQDEEYINSFKLNEKNRRVLENLDDEEDEDDEDIEEEINNDYLADSDQMFDKNELEDEESEEEEEIIHESIEYQEPIGGGESKIKTTIVTRHQQVNIKANRPASYDLEEDDDDDELNSLLPDESLPHINFDEDTTFQTEKKSKLKSKEQQEERNVIKRKPKNRPGLMDYFGDAINFKNSETENNEEPKYASTSMSYFGGTNDPSNNQIFTLTKKKYIQTESASSLSNKNNLISNQFYVRKNQQSEHQDIDETFDFLDEELKKY